MHCCKQKVRLLIFKHKSSKGEVQKLGSLPMLLPLQAMNRSLTNVVFGGLGTSGPAVKGKVELCDTQTKLCHQECDVVSK